MFALLRHGWILIGLCGAVAVPMAHQDAGRPERAPRSSRPSETLRERLRARPEPERARLERNLEEFERLSPEGRVKLLERARALRERERSVGKALPRELRTKMEALDPERAHDLWVAHLRERFRERGRELRARLPENLRQRLEQSPPEARRRFLERMFREREPVSRKALERMRVRYGLPGGEVRRLESMPLGERLRAMLELAQQSAHAPDAERVGG